EVLYPRIRDLEIAGNNPNLASLVLQVTANGHSVLLTGDIEADAERALLRYRPKLASDALKVAHHGSQTSSFQSFLNAVAPQVAVISVGAGNSFGHPSPEVLARFRCTPVLRTDLHGTITLSIGPSSARLWADRLASYDELGCSGAR
ncbi:MAG TPA: MBL fold metallo-hydrolase, partial [Dehalococcoidia bacterium]|nr:MBL fold metallo-hydrolase [Dehalococcoidia bacterium]